MKLTIARDEEKATMIMLKDRGDEERLAILTEKNNADALRLLYHPKTGETLCCRYE